MRLPCYHVPFAEAVRREVGILTMCPGLITEAHQAETILAHGCSDLSGPRAHVGPNWPVHAAHSLGVPDYLDLLPHRYAWWLKRREATRQCDKTPGAV